MKRYLKSLGIIGCISFSHCSNSIHAMSFEFSPLGKSSQVEVGLSTSFDGGVIRGIFPSVGGSIDFKVANPETTKGSIKLDARALKCGHYKVAGDAHSIEWLDSGNFPEISFKLDRLKNARWRDNVLFASASGVLRMKNRNSQFTIPVSIRYLRDQRRKIDGKRGDLIVLSGEASISRTQIGINPGTMVDAVMDQIRVKINLVGGSNQVRPFLPSALFK